jgi:ATP synthase F1 epsilon subunit
MSESFNLEIVNPEKLFLSLDNVSEVVVPAFEGDMGILKDHISIISFLKPGIVKVFSSNEVKELYVEDGIIEFSENSLSILTSRIIDVKEIKKEELSSMINEANEILKNENLDDQIRFMANQKIDVLNRLN